MIANQQFNHTILLNNELNNDKIYKYMFKISEYNDNNETYEYERSMQYINVGLMTNKCVNNMKKDGSHFGHNSTNYIGCGNRKSIAWRIGLYNNTLQESYRVYDKVIPYGYSTNNLNLHNKNKKEQNDLFLAIEIDLVCNLFKINWSNSNYKHMKKSKENFFQIPNAMMVNEEPLHFGVTIIIKNEYVIRYNIGLIKLNQ